MTAQFLFSPRALTDLDEIWDHSAREWGVERAEAYLRDLARHAQRLADNPALGRSCAEVRAGYYRYPAGAHVIFYRGVATGIEVIRILHARMDAWRHL
ncbi:type II toxin-antitoxin system RelE/ParE family toxin [Acetobacteraceae bacterium H6797]|nr:type II toxin-antitoxin system RelE/ParE family toxin [Acetobacteraceae bacterium H6797]